MLYTAHTNQSKQIHITWDLCVKVNRIYDEAEAKTSESQTSFHIILSYARFPC